MALVASAPGKHIHYIYLPNFWVAFFPVTSILLLVQENSLVSICSAVFFCRMGAMASKFCLYTWSCLTILIFEDFWACLYYQLFLLSFIYETHMNATLTSFFPFFLSPFFPFLSSFLFSFNTKVSSKQVFLSTPYLHWICCPYLLLDSPI